VPKPTALPRANGRNREKYTIKTENWTGGKITITTGLKMWNV